MDGQYETEMSAEQVALALTDPELRTLVLKLPQLLGLSYADEIEPKLETMQAELGCCTDINGR